MAMAEQMMVFLLSTHAMGEKVFVETLERSGLFAIHHAPYWVGRVGR